MRSTPFARYGGSALRVVVDSNVWFSGLTLPDSVPGQVLQAVRGGRLVVVATWDLAAEIARVLSGSKFRKYDVSEADVTETLGFLAPFLPSVDIEVGLRDPKDRIVVDAALTGEADAIVTGDRDLLDDTELRSRLAARGIRILTPRELLSEIQGVSEGRGRYAPRGGRRRAKRREKRHTLRP